MVELVSSVVAIVIDEEKQSEVSSSTCWSLYTCTGADYYEICHWLSTCLCN